MRLLGKVAFISGGARGMEAPGAGSLPGRGREVVIGNPPKDMTATTVSRAIGRGIERRGQDRELHPGLRRPGLAPNRLSRRRRVRALAGR